MALVLLPSQVLYEVFLLGEVVGPEGRPLRTASARFVGFEGLPRANPSYPSAGCNSSSLKGPVAVTASGSEIWITEEAGNQLQSMDNHGYSTALGVSAAGVGPLADRVNAEGCPDSSTDLLAGPRGAVVRLEDGALVFADTGHGRIVAYLDGALTDLAGGLQEPLVLGRLNDGRLVVGTGDDRVYLLSYGDRVLSLVGTGGIGDGEFRLGIGEGWAPQAVPGAGDEWFITEPGNHRVQRFSGTTATGWLGGGHEAGSGFQTGGTPVAGATPGQFVTPVGLAVDALGRLLVVDQNVVRLFRFTHEGDYVDNVTLPVDDLGAIAIDERNRLLLPLRSSDQLVSYTL